VGIAEPGQLVHYRVPLADTYLKRVLNFWDTQLSYAGLCKRTSTDRDQQQSKQVAK